MRYFFAGGRTRSPFAKLLAYTSFFSSRFFWIAVAILGGLNSQLGKNDTKRTTGKAEEAESSTMMA